MTEVRLLLPGPAVVGDLQHGQVDALQARRPLRLAHLAEAGGLLVGRCLVARDADRRTPG